ncbi:MAG: polyprenol phosphomannose-dependent alpha 1,6 mannosyltransferase MptB [Clostridia bacterium]|nr:polyprenol phosphomannose-dependent alpha 1,6 mannosyltransferase MptB [Clostridia bacterium]
MKKEKLISCLILVGIVFAIPSCLYLVRNTGNIAEYSGEYFYMIGNSGKFFDMTGALIFAWSVLLMFLIYWRLVCKSSEFQSLKSIILGAAVVGLAFLVCLPNLSQDVFFYMGNGRAIDKYGVNPYTTTVAEIEELDTTDVLLKTVGSQKEYSFVYGPVFLAICGLLNQISFSSVALFLYEFKILNFVAYLLTVYLVYRLTKKKKLTVAYAFNPLILLEVLVNVHNDIFVVLFALIGILLVKEAEKIRGKFWKSEITFLLRTCVFSGK